MSRVSEIIDRVRDTLSDQTEERHGTPRLLRALSECQSKIAKDTLCVRYKCTIELCSGYHTYKLDSSAVELKGGEPIAIYSIRNHSGKMLRFVTENYMDVSLPGWSTVTGEEVTHAIYDKQSPLIFRLYPTPLTDNLTDSTESFNITSDPLVDSASVVAPLTSPGNFDITSETAPIKVLVDFYLKPPPIVLVNDDNLLVPMHFDEAIPHYVAGVVLRDDRDSQHREFGMEELKLFESEYQVAKDLAKRDFTDQSNEIYASVDYNGAIK